MCRCVYSKREKKNHAHANSSHPHEGATTGIGVTRASLDESLLNYFCNVIYWPEVVVHTSNLMSYVLLGRLRSQILGKWLEIDGLIVCSQTKSNAFILVFSLYPYISIVTYVWILGLNLLCIN
ncbi:hypothetical protein D1007_44443 [Hordeum vulgare]|nr:hypothetical protein D1007_44443 [Hordeum vulgare]